MALQDEIINSAKRWNICDQCGASFTELDTVCPMCSAAIQQVVARAVEQKLIVICQVCKVPNLSDNIICTYCHNILGYSLLPKKILLLLIMWRLVNTILLVGTLFAPWVQNLYSSGPISPLSGLEVIAFFTTSPLFPIALSTGLGISVYIVMNTLRVFSSYPNNRRWLWIPWIAMLPGGICSIILLLTPYRGWGEYLFYTGLLSSGMLEVYEQIRVNSYVKKQNSVHKSPNFF